MIRREVIIPKALYSAYVFYSKYAIYVHETLTTHAVDRSSLNLEIPLTCKQCNHLIIDNQSYHDAAMLDHVYMLDEISSSQKDIQKMVQIDDMDLIGNDCQCGRCLQWLSSYEGSVFSIRHKVSQLCLLALSSYVII
jgi:hypothetical protein